MSLHYDLYRSGRKVRRVSAWFHTPAEVYEANAAFPLDYVLLLALDSVVMVAV